MNKSDKNDTGAPASSLPMGGTELLKSFLTAALPALTEQVQIICSRPKEVALENRPRILWLHDLAKDPAVALLRDAAYRAQFNRIVFVSHWQQQMYNLYLHVPYHEGIVIKNAVPLMVPDRSPATNGKLKFIYTSTPHRGLAILSLAADALLRERRDWELHVYSSMKIYGRGQEDAKFASLYEALDANPCITYHDTQPNIVVRQALADSQVFVYPSVYPETSCLAIQEAMMAGCLAITTNYGALPETCGEWAWMFQYDENPKVLVNRTLDYMRRAFDSYESENIQSLLKMQSLYYQQFFSFESRVPAWRTLLEEVIKEGAP